MKILSIVLFSFLCFMSYDLAAQTRKQIGEDLSKLHKKIEYWSDQRYKENATPNWSDSLDNANTQYSKKLIYCSEKYDFTIKKKTGSLELDSLGCASPDEMLKIYSWDPFDGGTQHASINVIQYRVGKEMKAIQIDEPDKPNTYYKTNFPFYTEIYDLKINNKTYYIVLYEGVLDLYVWSQGVRIFTIENGKLDINVRLFKTTSGLHSRIEYQYNYTFRQ